MPLPPIIFEDDVIVAFNKPGGMRIVPDQADPRRESLMPLIRARFGDAIANVHRLDAEASGLFLCAKTKAALDFLSGQFQSKSVRKLFVAFVVVLPVERAMKVLAPVRDVAGGLPDTFTIDAALGEDERNKGRMRIFKGRGGKDSITEFQVLERFGRFAWIKAEPITGRTHQIRVHLASAGAPVLNDGFYGDPEIKLLLSDFKRGYKGREEEKPLLSGLALHASELTLQHPLTREPLTLVAPLSHEFEIALKYMRKFAKDKG